MKLSAVLPGYSSVSHAAEVLNLAPRSVRDLIYSGRLLSVRIGRWHFIRGTDLERERRRRLGLPLPRPRAQSRTTRQSQHHERIDPALRAQRAAERIAARREWAEQHRQTEPALPFRSSTVGPNAQPTTCASCHRPLGPGARVVEQLSTSYQPQGTLCARCGRRALLAWADERRAESAAARTMAEELGERRGGELSDRLAA